MSAAIEISISELHEHTDRYVREAAAKRILITDHGKHVAELQPATPSPSSEVPYFARRKLRSGFQEMMESGAFRPRPGDRDITDLISEDRDGN